VKSNDLVAVLLLGVGATTTAIAALALSRGRRCCSQLRRTARAAVAWIIVAGQIFNSAASFVAAAAGFTADQIVTSAALLVSAADGFRPGVKRRGDLD
jgi:hypothetical protein